MFFKGINHYGDLGLILDFGSDSSQQISQEVNAVYALLQDLDLPQLNIIPSFNKIVLAFQSSKDRNQAQDAIEHNLAKANLTNSQKDRKIWNIPACYEDSYALDRELIQATHGLSKDEVLRNVKKRSSFAGSMRKNLIQMLDELKLNEKLNIKSSLSLFKESNHLLHTTSALKYPVFKNGKNYTGSSPSPIKNSFLWEEINNGLVNEMSLFKSKLIIPLGKTVSEILSQIKSDGKLNENILLDGFPHPSGANGHRKKQFQMNSSNMAKKIKDWKINN